MDESNLTCRDVLAAVAAHAGMSPDDYRASKAPKGSSHDGIWYVSERDFEKMQIDDCVWIVLPNMNVIRGIPVGNPIHEPTDLDRLA